MVGDIDIPYTKYVLDNGLTLIVHEDHKAPIVAVNIWYHIGSKNERPGKTGFAHLFEHLMFSGSEHFDGEYIQQMEKIGATDLNGTTNEDRTNYFQNVPTSAVDLALWMESDRMGHLLGAITQDKLDEQRGVVQNEKRQYENQPYGMVEELITKSVFPAGHPYSWTVIGSMEDLNAASLADVKEWFQKYYGAANAVLVMAGDITPEAARQKVEKYFGDIPPGPPVSHYEAWIAKRTGVQRQSVQDRVPQARIYKVWNVPQWGTAECDYLGLFSDILARGKTSRLYKRLVYDEQIATSVSAYVDAREIAGLFSIEATASPGEDLQKVEKAIDEELARLIQQGPTEQELQRVKTEYIASFIRGIERIGGFGGKSDILAKNQVFANDPAYYKVTLKRIEKATVEDVRQTAQQWLTDGEYILEVHPFPEYKTKASDVDRSKLPPVGEPPAAKFPELQKATLSNGLEIVLAERHSVPVVIFNLLVDAGYAADQFALPGTAKLTMEMIDEGTKRRDALQISEELAQLGARLRTGSNLDMSIVYLSALKANLRKSLDIYADVILNPSFPDADFERLKKQQLASIKREKVTPAQLGYRVLPGLLYGKSHAYGHPLTGSGTEESVSRITRADLVKFHDTWFKPNHATLVVVGDITLDEVKPELEKFFGHWQKGDIPRKNIQTVEYPDQSVVYLLERPDAIQSVIFAGQVAPPKANPIEIAIETMNNILGGTFSSRLNLNLREDKHWTYGAFSMLINARGQRPFMAYAPVQTDKTKEAMLEILREFQGISADRPPTPDELHQAIENQTMELPGSWETMNAVSNTIANLVRFNLPDDYYNTFPNKLKKLRMEDVAEAARNVLQPAHLVWVVVGDRKKIEPQIRQAGFKRIKYIDGDGNEINH